ncbi:hypothetical protein OF83DRAFT_1069703, partial [Amylostereum chailletii]
ICDLLGRIIIVFHGRPEDSPRWNASCEEAVAAMADTQIALGLHSQVEPHRRGTHPSINAGISFGNGHTAPLNFRCNSTHRGKIIHDLLTNLGVTRIAGFASAAFASMAPKLYNYYEKTIVKILNTYPSLTMPYMKSIFAATTFNLGGNVWTCAHADMENLTTGWCSITALGNFDPKRGGHLVLHTLRMVVEFPPNSVASILSSTIVHSNTPIQPGETRWSITVYTAGGLFCHAEYDCQLEADFAKEHPEHYEEIKSGADTRWMNMVDMFSTMDELPGDYQRVFGFRHSL